MHANAIWIRNVIGKLRLPRWISEDDLFADVMPDVLSCLKTYNSGKSSLHTYLYLVVYRSAMKAVKQYENPSDGSGHEAYKEDSEQCDVVGLIQKLVAAMPDEEINESGRKLVSRMLRGYNTEEIASQMGWGCAETQVAVEKQRLLIAWLMARGGHSADPFIDDATLADMAMQHETQRDGWWK